MHESCHQMQSHINKISVQYTIITCHQPMRSHAVSLHGRRKLGVKENDGLMCTDKLNIEICRIIKRLINSSANDAISKRRSFQTENQRKVSHGSDCLLPTNRLEWKLSKYDGSDTGDGRKGEMSVVYGVVLRTYYRKRRTALHTHCACRQ